MDSFLCTPRLLLVPEPGGWQIQDKLDRSVRGRLRRGRNQCLVEWELDGDRIDLLHEAAAAAGARQGDEIDPESPLGQSLRQSYRPAERNGDVSLRDICRQLVHDWRSHYAQRISSIHRDLGLPRDYAERFQLPVVAEAMELCPIGDDLFQRPQLMAPFAAQAWRRMTEAAAADGIELLPVSAFRTLEYQTGLLRRKIERGLDLSEILFFSAAPGFSQHHSGCAIDIHSGSEPPLEERFEDTAAFSWLQQRAVEFGFYLSFPRQNPYGIAYEPWHWSFDVQPWQENLSPPDP